MTELHDDVWKKILLFLLPQDLLQLKFISSYFKKLFLDTSNNSDYWKQFLTSSTLSLDSKSVFFKFSHLRTQQTLEVDSRGKIYQQYNDKLFEALNDEKIITTNKGIVSLKFSLINHIEKNICKLSYIEAILFGKHPKLDNIIDNDFIQSLIKIDPETATLILSHPDLYQPDSKLSKIFDDNLLILMVRKNQSSISLILNNPNLIKHIDQFLIAEMIKSDPHCREEIAQHTNPDIVKLLPKPSKTLNKS